MQRQIKFRIFEYNKMHYPKQYKENKFDNYFIDLNGELRYYQNCYDGGFFDTENAKLMQFTGLYDKNGKEIYEGDIVKILGGEYEQGFYEWDETVQIKDLIYDGFNLMMTISQIGNQAIEVIGNIYDNPELLERSSNGD